jgi:hypothetical protein
MGGVYNTVNLHLYHYAGNNPLKYTDPDGKEVKIVLFITKIEPSIIGKTAMGTITVTDLDTGNSLAATFVSGGRPYGDHIPTGDYTVLQPNKAGHYRLEARDTNYGDDAVGMTGQSQIRLHGTGSGRTMGCVSVAGDDNWKKIDSLNEEPRSKILGIFDGEEIYCTGVFHTPSRKSAYNIFGDDKFSGASSGVWTTPIKNTSTTIDEVPVLNQWLPWNKGETENLENFGTLTVINGQADAITRAAQTGKTNG